MPQRRPPALRDNATPTARANFRQRYDELEAQRAALIARLRKLSKDAHQHPSYKRALKLLNGPFRRSKLGQRLAVLGGCHVADRRAGMDHFGPAAFPNN